MASLIKSLCNLPLERDERKRITLSIGHSANKISIERLLDLLYVAHNRVNIDLNDIEVIEMINRS